MEIAFEILAAAIEATRGTAVDPPTRNLNLAGLITPAQSRYRPDESRGRLAKHNRSRVVRKWSEWEGEGPADVYTLPMLLNAAIKALSSPSTPVGATNARLWTFAPTMTADDLKTLTLYSGDPNVQAFQAAFGTVDEFTLKGDSSGEDGVNVSVKGWAHPMAKNAPDSIPGELEGPLLAPGNMQLWLDTSSGIGSTEITDGRLISAEFSIKNELSYKWTASGPEGALSYNKIGRGKRAAELKLVFEVPDMDEYDLFGTDTEVKARVRFNGPEIEDGFYHYVECDIYGPADGFAWAENQGTNRTIEITIISEYNATAGHDFAVRVQNDRATL